MNYFFVTEIIICYFKLDMISISNALMNSLVIGTLNSAFIVSKIFSCAFLRSSQVTVVFTALLIKSLPLLSSNFLVFFI